VAYRLITFRHAGPPGSDTAWAHEATGAIQHISPGHPGKDEQAAHVTVTLYDVVVLRCQILYGRHPDRLRRALIADVLFHAQAGSGARLVREQDRFLRLTERRQLRRARRKVEEPTLLLDPRVF
jgi:hypothetical protein